MAVKESNIAEVSVIIPAFNAEKTIQRAIYSTLNQGVSLEIIVVDDCSADQTVNILKKLQNHGFANIRIFTTPQNMGASGARNIGIKEAKSDFIAFLDADDVWLPQKISKQLAILRNNTECSIVSCDSFKVSPAGNMLTRAHNNKSPIAGNTAWKVLLRYNFIPTPTVMTRTVLLKEIGGFDESLCVGEDLDLWISLAKRGSVEYVPEILVHYFDYSNSLMKRDGPGSEAMILDMILRHINESTAIHKNEKKSILASRYVELGYQTLFFGDMQEAETLFLKAVDNGCDKSFIYKLKVKHFIKNLPLISYLFD